jgi:hypothetical protein
MTWRLCAARLTIDLDATLLGVHSEEGGCARRDLQPRSPIFGGRSSVPGGRAKSAD